MTRPLRVEYPGAYYHVISRGNNRENIFINERDKEKFAETLARAAERFSIAIHTYCLMSNHYHLLVQTPDANLSQAMQWINISHAAYFNRKHDRHGHLFQGRFKAILIEADEYLTHLSRYIHLNPVRANMVSSAADYQWSSYRCFIGKEKEPTFLEINRLLSYFGKTKKKAQQKYRDFVERIDVKILENPDKHITEGFVLGGPDFIDWIKETYLSARRGAQEIPPLKSLKPKVTPGKIVQAVSTEFGCSAVSVIAKGRKNNKARAVAIYFARELSGMSGTDLGYYFGGVRGASITMTYSRVAAEVEQNRRLKSKVGRIKNRILNM